MNRRVVSVAALALTALFHCCAADADIDHFESMIKQERYSDAKSGLESYTASHPRSWEAWYQLGYVQFRLHLVKPSLDSLCRSLAMHPDFAESHKVLAYDLNILGRQDLAIHELTETLRLDSSSAEAHYELGRIYYERGSYANAISQLERAKTLSPSSVRTYHNLGLAYAATGENVRAVQNFEAALHLNMQTSKRSAWPYIDYATYCNMQSEFAKARNLLLEGIQIDDSWDQEFSELEKAYRGLNQTAEAITAIQKAISLNPHKPEYHYVLARLYSRVQNAGKAKDEMATYEVERSRGK